MSYSYIMKQYLKWTDEHVGTGKLSSVGSIIRWQKSEKPKEMVH